MADERGAKGTVVYQMKAYADATRMDIRSVDIVLGVDKNGVIWVLIQQAVR